MEIVRLARPEARGAVGNALLLEIRMSELEPGVADPDWRERRRLIFRTAIFESAEELIRETGGTDFTMRVLAEKARVALVTPYNMFGSKAGVLYGLLDKCVRTIDEQVDKRAVADPLEQIFDVSRISADTYGKDPALYRPLLRYLSGALEREHHHQIFARAMHLYHSAIERGTHRGFLAASIRTEILERHLLVNFTGVLQFWIQEELDAVGFRNHVLYGTALVLIPHAVPKYQARLMRYLAEFEKSLPKALAKPPSMAKAKPVRTSD